MNSIDLVIIIPIVIGFILGMFKGLIKELASLLAIILGIYGAKLFSPSVSKVLVQSFDFSLRIAQPVAYIVVFVAIAIVLLFIASSLDKLFDSIALGGLNKFLGGLFGGLKYALIMSVLMIVFNVLDSKFNFVNPETKADSFLHKPIMNLAPKLWEEVKTREILPQKNKKEE